MIKMFGRQQQQPQQMQQQQQPQMQQQQQPQQMPNISDYFGSKGKNMSDQMKQYVGNVNVNKSVNAGTTQLNQGIDSAHAYAKKMLDNQKLSIGTNFMAHRALGAMKLGTKTAVSGASYLTKMGATSAQDYVDPRQKGYLYGYKDRKYTQTQPQIQTPIKKGWFSGGIKKCRTTKRRQTRKTKSRKNKSRKSRK